MPTLELSGAPGRTRTLDPVIRSHILGRLLALIYIDKISKTLGLPQFHWFFLLDSIEPH
jgi:hypothetical protein